MKNFAVFLMAGFLICGAGCKQKTPVAATPAATNQMEQTAAVVPAAKAASQPSAAQPAKVAPVMIKVAGSTNRVPMVP